MEKKSTIVRYRDDLPPENGYPRKIVSPVLAGPCCLLHSRETGKVRREGGWRYIYVRCHVCGYTVRRILGRAGQRPQRPKPWQRRKQGLLTGGRRHPGQRRPLKPGRKQ